MSGPGSGRQDPPDGMDAEEAEKCPICLCILAGGELAMPNSCSHIFCLRCLLTWAELQFAPSCPVDRRPFSYVYRWDENLSCVQVPIRRREPQPEAESCCCRHPEKNVCLKSKPAKRLRRKKVEMTSNAKAKGLVRKCNDDDPSSLSRKKVRGTECYSWSPCVSLTAASTRNIVEPVWVAEDIPYDPGFKQCKPLAQDCPWLFAAAPVPADSNSRHDFNPSGWNHCPFPFGFSSSPFTSSSMLGPGQFVFEGVACAITCPKGGEKRGGRASASDAPPKEAESLPARRSGRHSKTQEEAPASDPSPQSSSSDSDSSMGQSAKPSQAPAKKKSKQVTNRKASNKRKTTRKKTSPELVNTLAPSEEEEEEEAVDNKDEEEEDDKTDQEQDLNNSNQPQSKTEGSINEDQDSFNSTEDILSNNVGQVTEETQEQSNEHELKPNEGDLSCSSDPEPVPLEAEDEGDQRREDRETTSPVSSGQKDSESKTTPSPSASQRTLLENPLSPHGEEQDDNMDICAESEEFNNEESSKVMTAESCENSPQLPSPSVGESEDDLAAPESKASEDTDTEKVGSEDPSEVDGSGKETEDDSQSKDDTKVVAMDCSSPVSENGNITIFEQLKESTASAAAQPPASSSQVTKDNSHKEQQERERSLERKNGRQRRSRFHSPTSTWSPKRDSKQESSRRSLSRERSCSPPSSRLSRARSREREKERDGEKEYSRREHSRERRRRRSRSRSSSRSRSRSRTRSHRRGTTPERPTSREHSPQWRERRGGWRSGQGSGSVGEGRRSDRGAGRFENGMPTESSPDRQGWSENPDWVTEKSRGEADSRNRDSSRSSRWEDNRIGSRTRGEPRGRGRLGRDAGCGSNNRSFYNQQDEAADNRWQPRNLFSGTGNNSGNDSYSRFNENRGGGRRKDSEPGDSMVDRSGWSSASSWAVRRTLPADVQDYYSKRERGASSSWNRQEEEQQPAADLPKSEPPTQAIPGNAPVPVMNMIPPQLNVLHHPYPMQGPQGALPVSLQPAAPYGLPPQVPVHLHPAVPLLQIPAAGPHGLPPPPPPPPPMLQGSHTAAAAAQPDGYTSQMLSTMGGYGKPAPLPTPTKAGIAVATQGQPASNQALPSSTTQFSHHSRAQADSSKKEKKQQIQEKAINEVKMAIKPFYQRKDITKEEYKEIVRKAVEKVCHSKSGEVNSSKVANLVKAYVDKYKHARKK